MFLWNILLLLMLNYFIPNSKKGIITCSLRDDGMGAQIHSIYSALLYSKAAKKKYFYTPLKKVAHNYTKDPQWEKKVENFFGLTFNNIINECNVKTVNLDLSLSILKYILYFFFISRKKPVLFKKEHFHEYAEEFISEYSIILDEIKVAFNQNKASFNSLRNENVLMVACHIRRGDVSSNNLNNINRFTDNNKIEIRIKYLITLFKKNKIKYDLHFFSQGKEGDFGELIKYGQFHLDDNPFAHFFNMTIADIFLMSKSSFSYTSAMLSSGIVCYEKFWHKPFPEWCIIEENNLNKSGIERELKKYILLKTQNFE